MGHPSVHSECPPVAGGKLLPLPGSRFRETDELPVPPEACDSCDTGSTIKVVGTFKSLSARFPLIPRGVPDSYVPSVALFSLSWLLKQIG